MNLDELRTKSPEILEPMQTLLKMAYGYLQYALEAYELPDPGNLIKKNVIPSPWGSIYLLGAPSDLPQIGVIAERISIKELRAKQSEREEAAKRAQSKTNIEAIALSQS
jgi:hypothetical protein